MIFAHEFGHQLLSFHASGVLAAACRAPVICANASCTGGRGHYGPRGRRFESCGPAAGQGPSSRREGVPFASRTAAEFRSRSLTTGSRRGCHQMLERRPRLLGRHLGAELHRDRGLRVAEDLQHHAGMDVEVDEQGGRPDACRSAPQVSRPADVLRLHGIPYRVVNTRLKSCHASPAAARARILQTGAPRLRDTEGRQRQRDVGLLRLDLRVQGALDRAVRWRYLGGNRGRARRRTLARRCRSRPPGAAEAALDPSPFSPTTTSARPDEAFRDLVALLGGRGRLAAVPRSAIGSPVV
jgi:hypothetical protein